MGSNHSSFASQYPALYTDLTPLVPAETVAGFVPAHIEAATLDGKLVILPRAQFDVSALYYQKSLYADPARPRRSRQSTAMTWPCRETWDQVRDQAMFFAETPNFYGTQFAGKEEGITGRFYELVVANGGTMFNEDFSPAFQFGPGQDGACNGLSISTRPAPCAGNDQLPVG